MSLGTVPITAIVDSSLESQRRKNPVALGCRAKL